MSVVKASAKGQVVIPKKVRDKLGIVPGSQMVIRVVGDHAELRPLPDDPISSLRGSIAGASMANDLLEERARDECRNHPDRG